MPRLSEYPYKLIREQAVRLGGTPKEDTVMGAWRVEYKRTTGTWRHFILLLDGVPNQAQILDACAAHEKDYP